MKKLQPVLIFILVLACVFIRKPSGHDQQIEQMREEIKSYKYKADSLNQYAKGVKDSLNIALNTIKIQDSRIKQDSIKARKAQRYYESIIFKPIASDHDRDSLLSELYPSFRPVR